MRTKPAPPLGGYAPAGSYGPQAALRPRFALPPGIPQGFRYAAPLALRAHPHIEAPKGGRIVPPVTASPPRPRTSRIGTPPLQGLQERAGHRQCPQQTALVHHPLPSPPPLPAGKGSESPSVVRGAGCAALRLLLLPPAGERWGVPRASRVRFALRGGPCPRLRLRAAPATPTALDPLST